MPNRFDWNAVEGKITQAIADYPELTRSKALTCVAMSAIIDISMEEAVDAITDGGFDRGVDALFIDDRDGRLDIHIWQAKCVTQFDKSTNAFPSSEIDKVCSFVSDLTGADMAALRNANAVLADKIRAALGILDSPHATIKVHFVGNTDSLVATEFDRITAVFDRYRAISFEMHNLDHLANHFLERRQPRFDRTLSTVDTENFERSDRNLRGVVCTVAATEIVDAIRSAEDPNKVELGVFDQNVRVFLSNRNRVNSSIIDSALSDENHMFWYLNNGITITCDQLTFSPSRRAPQIALTNFQIVNGGQTSNCLFEAARANPEQVESVVVMVRIIQTTNEEVKHSIAASTNSQTPINVRDLKANDRLQRQLEESFADLGFYYERKANQHADRPRRERVDALTAGQSFLGYGLGLPEVAKKDRGRVFGNLYDTIFTDETSAPMLLTSSKLVELINAEKTVVRGKIRTGDEIAPGEQSFIDGAFHVLFAIRQICLREGLDIWDFDVASSVLEEAKSIIFNLFEAERAKSDTFTANQFFKDSRTKDMVTRVVG